MPFRCNNAAQAESNKAERHAVLSFAMKAGDGDALPIDRHHGDRGAGMRIRSHGDRGRAEREGDSNLRIHKWIMNLKKPSKMASKS